jgi:hypothetical protein
MRALPHRLDDAQRLVTDDEEIGTRGRFAVEPVIDLGVGAVDPDLQHSHQRHLGGDLRNGELDLPGAAGLLGVTATARMVAVSVRAIDLMVGSVLIESPAARGVAPVG